MIGLLYPTRDCAEDDFTALAGCLDARPGVEFAYVPWARRTVERENVQTAVRELSEPDRLVRTAKTFTTSPRVVSWACTSCSFVDGVAVAKTQTAALTDALDVPASSTSLAFIAAAHRLGLDRVALASVYAPEITDKFAAFLAEENIATVHAVSANAGSDRDLAGWDSDRIRDLVRSAGSPDAQAVLLPETALHTAPLLAELENLAGKPVLTATQVTLWHCLTLLGRPAAGPGLGALLAHPH
ncbi:decarboxylase [Amycolatopsis sp. WGS_07]|uniref:maleate cis-trans isomerase family protein n=1 Tax=Amycolatopsis sp. WGS_07 TaxID=3076764 RepID=UPI003873C2A0